MLTKLDTNNVPLYVRLPVQSVAYDQVLVPIRNQIWRHIWWPLFNILEELL